MMLIDDIEFQYIDDNGMVLVNPWGHTADEAGNPLLNTSVYMLLINKFSSVPLSLALRFEKLIHSCECIPGLYKASPTKNDIASWDDYVGVSAASKQLDLGFTNDILAHYPKEYDRFILTIPYFYQLCNLQSLSIYKQATLSLSIVLDAVIGNASGHVLMFCITEGARGTSRLVDLAIKLWEASMSVKYKTLGRMFAATFPEVHPFCRINKKFRY